jgi:hypothetical protein
MGCMYVFFLLPIAYRLYSNPSQKDQHPQWELGYSGYLTEIDCHRSWFRPHCHSDPHAAQVLRGRSKILDMHLVGRLDA